MSMSPGRAERIIEARIAVGVKYNSFVKHCSDMITTVAITMFDANVSQPAVKLTTVREKEPVQNN